LKFNVFAQVFTCNVSDKTRREESTVEFQNRNTNSLSEIVTISGVVLMDKVMMSSAFAKTGFSFDDTTLTSNKLSPLALDVSKPSTAIPNATAVFTSHIPKQRLVAFYGLQKKVSRANLFSRSSFQRFENKTRNKNGIGVRRQWVESHQPGSAG
jgi:hypothetical protein